MGLPNVDKSVIENVEAAEKEDARAAALAKAGAGSKATTATKEAPDPAAPAEAETKEVATAAKQELAPVEDMEGALANLDLTDMDLDFTSFPTMVIDKGKIKRSGGSMVDDGESFEFIFVQKRKTFLFRGIEDRDKDPELAYSDDEVHINMTGELVADKITEWTKKGWAHEKKEYFIVLAQKVGGEYDGEIIQLQIPRTSIGRFDGYRVNLKIRNLDPAKVISKALVGEEVGSGLRAFSPWDFKFVSAG